MFIAIVVWLVLGLAGVLLSEQYFIARFGRRNKWYEYLWVLGGVGVFAGALSFLTQKDEVYKNRRWAWVLRRDTGDE